MRQSSSKGRRIIPVEVEERARERLVRIPWQAYLADLDRQVMSKIHGQTDVTPSGVIREWYAILDPIVSNLAAVAICQRGCSHCCRIPVSITNHEANLIGEVIQAKPVRVTKPLSEAKAAARFSTACPFLKDNQCSIYEVRPYACRTHFSVDEGPQWCDFSDRVVHRVAYPDRRAFDVRHMSLMEAIETSLSGQPRLPVLADIREWFPNGAKAG